jgi:FeS assembly SUF system regulator
MSKKADYGLVLMTQFVRSADHVTNLSARELARQTRLPLPMVSKVLKALAREGLLVSHRGPSGGYSLSRKPEHISVAEVLTAVEGPIAVTECLDDTGGCRQQQVCPVKTNWERVNFAIKNVLDAVTLQDMIEPLPEGWVTLGDLETGTAEPRAPVEEPAGVA